MTDFNFQALGSSRMVINEPATVVYDNNFLHVFVRRATDSMLLYKKWDGNRWTPGGLDQWDELGGPVDSKPTAVVTNTNPPRIDVFAKNSNGKLWHKYWNGASWEPSETSWRTIELSLGGSLKTAPVAARVVDHPDTNIVIFAAFTDDKLYHLRLVNGSGHGWQRVGDVNDVPNFKISTIWDPVAIGDGIESATLLARNPNNQLVTIDWKLQMADMGLPRRPVFTAWHNAGDIVSNPVAVRTVIQRNDPSAPLGVTDRYIHVFGRDIDSVLRHAMWSDDSEPSQQWNDLGLQCCGNSALVVDNKVYVFAIDARDQRFNFRIYDLTNSPWPLTGHGWSQTIDLGKCLCSDFTATYWQNRKMVFINTDQGFLSVQVNV